MFELAEALRASPTVRLSERNACYVEVMSRSPYALAHGFAKHVLYELRKLCPDAGALQTRKGRLGADLGIEEHGEFEPLLRVASPSNAANVMSLMVRHHGRWEPTFVRGTPAIIAAQLAGPFAYLWRMHVAAIGFEPTNVSSPRTKRLKPR
jgi:hypothetical protein